MEKSRLYLAGTNFTVITDHQPLVGVLNGKNLDAINNLRIHRIMSKLIGYKFRLLWTPGKTHHIADALSSYPLFPPDDEDDVLVCSIWVARGEVTEEETESDPALERLIEHATNDEDYQKVYLAVKNHKKLNELPKDHPAQHYRSYWHAMSLEQTLPKLGGLWFQKLPRKKLWKRSICNTPARTKLKQMPASYIFGLVCRLTSSK